MKAFILVLALFFVAPSTLAQKRVLADFRTDRTTAPTRIPAATRKRVLAQVFKSYLTDANRCNSQFEAGAGADFLESARKAGQIVPSVTDMLQGNFTSAGKLQTAYIISVSECFASHADNFGSTRIAIFNGETLVTDLDLEFRNTVVKKTDLDGDGVNELLMSSGYMNQGILTLSAALLAFKDAQVNVIQDFGQVSENSCASGLPGSEVSASVIHTVTELIKMPTFQIEKFKSTCRTPPRWTVVPGNK